jgi:hypothetical protein
LQLAYSLKGQLLSVTSGCKLVFQADGTAANLEEIMSTAREERREERIERREARQEMRANRTPEERQRRFYIHFAVYAIVVGSLAVMNYSRNPDHIWVHWVAMGWGIGVAAHGARAFGLVSPKQTQ